MGRRRGCDPLRGFDEAWDHYRTLCRGKLIEKRGQGPLSAAAATMAVRTAEGPWDDPYSPCGEWLGRLRERDERDAERVLDAVREFAFIEVPVGRVRPTGGEVAAVTLGGATALGSGSVALAHLLGMGVSLGGVGTATVAGALLGWSTASGVRSRSLSRKDGELLHAYLEQLDTLREQIAGIAGDEA